MILSFDDGFKDFVEYAMPLLAKHRIAVNHNVIGNCVATGMRPWHARLYDFLDSAPESLLRQISLPGFTSVFDGTRRRARERFGLELSRYLKNRPRAERAELLAILEPLINRVEVDAPSRMMDARDLREAARIHEIGAHSFDHDSMGFEDDAFFLRDFDLCRAFFRRELDQPIGVYAFPNDSWRRGQLGLLAENGVDHVLLVGEQRSATTNNIHPRITMRADSPAEARLRALGHTPLHPGPPRRHRSPGAGLVARAMWA